MNFQKPRGTLDWYGEPLAKFNSVADSLRVMANLYDFEEIVTPTFENLELFTRSVGESSDIVSKELYNFKDKSDRDLALRPEGTAGAVRSFVENKMFANKTGPVKLFYLLNLFRYERPQGGRLREFHQFGVEYLNAANPFNDVEAISFAHDILEFFELNKDVVLKINNLGSVAQRQIWMEELKKYFEQYKSELTADSLKRLEKNPLRILDDKVDGKKDFVLKAPKLSAYLSEEDKEYFNLILACLDNLKIKYEVDDSLVRGLDYYTGVVFEFVSNNPNLEGKSTLIGGGRYSNLVKEIGGPDYEGIGFAIGIERLIMALEASNYDFNLNSDLVAFIGCASESLTLLGLSAAKLLRNSGLKTSIEYGEYKKDRNAKLAIRNKAMFFIWIDDEGLKSDSLTVENLRTHQKETIKFIDLAQYLNEKYDEYMFSDEMINGNNNE